MTYEEALKEAYKQPWVSEGDGITRSIVLSAPIKTSDRGWIITFIPHIETSMAEYIVNLHNTYLNDMEVAGVFAEAAQVSPPKSLHDLTDEQIEEICKLAWPHDFRDRRSINRDTDRIYVSYVTIQGQDFTVVIFNTLDIKVDLVGEVTPKNLYQIYEYLRSLGIKPV